MHDWADGQQRQDRQRTAQDAQREVGNEHLEADRDAVLGCTVELLEKPCGERANDHGTQEHGDVGADHDPGGGDRTDHRAAIAVYQLAAGVADQERQQERDHRANELREGLVGQPAGGNEERGDQAPGDERPDVGHDHTGQEAAKLLEPCLPPRAGCRRGEWERRRRHVFFLLVPD